MAEFKEDYLNTLHNEGGLKLTNIPGDSGGRTWAGISEVENPDFEGWPIIDSMQNSPDYPQCLSSNPQLLNRTEAFYISNFWNRINGNAINNESIVRKLYDDAVNLGITPAIRILQEAEGAPITGKIDTATLQIINS